MATIKRFEDLEVWQIARAQTKEIYKLTQTGSFAKDFELKDQINSSAGSAMDNIAEGFDRFTNKDFCHFLVISKGSNAEVRSQRYRAFDRNHISEEMLNTRLDFSVMLGNKIKSFIDYLTSSKYKTKPPKQHQPPISTSNIQPPTSNLQHPTSDLQPPA